MLKQGCNDIYSIFQTWQYWRYFGSVDTLSCTFTKFNIDGVRSHCTITASADCPYIWVACSLRVVGPTPIQLQSVWPDPYLFCALKNPFLDTRITIQGLYFLSSFTKKQLSSCKVISCISILEEHEINLLMSKMS